MKTLRPHKHKNLDFFITDGISISTFRNEIASMEHPFFALKGGDTKERKYKNGRVTVIVRALASLGLATIFDKDIWIYAISKLQEAINNNEKTSRTIIFTPYDFFVKTNRNTSGRAYEDLEKTLTRLSGTRITTNIIYSEDSRKMENFGLIDKWIILGSKKGKLDIGMVKVTLPEWVYHGLYKNKVLKISPDYFRIRKAIDRRIYEIARKHCGNQNNFVISLEKLFLKTGSSSNKREFKRLLKNLCLKNDLPDYTILYNQENDNVIFKNKHKNNKKKFLYNKKKQNNKKIKQYKEKIKKKFKTSEKRNSINFKNILKIPKGFRI